MIRPAGNIRQARAGMLPNRVQMTRGGSGITFKTGAAQFSQRMQQSRERFVEGIRQLMEETKLKWIAEAKKRVPVLTGVLRDSIDGAVERMKDTFTVIVGTAVEYSIFVEFGTRYIAGGRVYSLGLSPEITDSMAIQDWPAKSERGGGPDQMPWLRPSWWAIEPWFMEQLQYVVLNAFRA